MGFEHELRLIWLVGVNAAVIASAARAARRCAGDAPARLADFFLWWWLIQYLAVGIPGLAGALSGVSITLVAVGLSAGLWWASGRIAAANTPVLSAPGRGAYDGAIFLGCAGFVACFVLASVWDARLLPAMGDDPLTYHLPAAATWLRDGRIGVFETWFFNPANAYSPLGGSVFAAWWMAPLGHDAAARFMQAPAGLAIFAATAAIARRAGAEMSVAAGLGVAAALCRPVATQFILAKDDLFLCACVLLVIANAGRRDGLAGVRLGAAIGLAAATKYTAVYPLLALAPLVGVWPKVAAGARWAWGQPWRRAIAATGVAGALAGPWLVRNWLATGSPIFPIRAMGLDGMFATRASTRVGSIEGMRQALIEGYFGVGGWMAAAVAIAWAASVVVTALRGAWREPVVLCVVIGPVLAIAAFIVTSPYAEARFILAPLAMAIASVAILSGWNRPIAGVATVMLAVIAVANSFEPSWSARFASIAAVGAMIWMMLALIWLARPRARVGMVLIAGIIAFAGAWVNWKAYVQSLRDAEAIAWSSRYGELAEAWAFVRALPPVETVAYTNTYLTYPLLGASLDRAIVHIPVSQRVKRLSDLPALADRQEESTLLAAVVDGTYADADRETWRMRVMQSTAQWLLVAKAPLVEGAPRPVEAEWARGDAAFAIAFENPAAVIYAISRSDAGPGG